MLHTSLAGKSTHQKFQNYNTTVRWNLLSQTKILYHTLETESLAFCTIAALSL